MLFEQFQNGGHLWYWNENDFSNSEFPCRRYSSSMVSIRLSVCEQMSRCGLKSFKMAAVAAIYNIAILAVLNLHVASMPPTKF